MPKISNGTAEGLLKAMFRECSPLESLLVNVINFTIDQLEPLVYKDNNPQNWAKYQLEPLVRKVSQCFGNVPL